MSDPVFGRLPDLPVMSLTEALMRSALETIASMKPRPAELLSIKECLAELEFAVTVAREALEAFMREKAKVPSC